MRIIIFASLLIAVPIILIAEDSPTATKMTGLETTSRVVHIKTQTAEFDEKKFFIIKRLPGGAFDPEFHEIQCDAEAELYPGSCRAVPLGDAKFLVIDCFVYNSVAHACILLKYNSNGVIDSEFVTPFSSSFEEIIYRNPTHLIKAVDDVYEFTGGNIEVIGQFISPLLGWDHKKAYQEIGDDLGKQCSVLLSKDGKFISSSLPKGQ